MLFPLMGIESMQAKSREIKIPTKKIENPRINGFVINNAFTVASIPEIIA